ncbi:hypothetical protein H312_01782 [Anncaliia algerae PRA339]|uniref:ethanolamine kinase n=1 Tax=Anncaliia algerae PRA339 TaxID=1288291 RepID=A0A059F1E8_9MICR|nr:hypothetical protein H312_01782 [Anncaliia algerae PRA339]
MKIFLGFLIFFQIKDLLASSCVIDTQNRRFDFSRYLYAKEILSDFEMSEKNKVTQLFQTNHPTYILEADSKKYFMKRFIHPNNNIENKVACLIQFPKVIHMGRDFRIEEYVEFEEFDFEDDFKLIAKALASFHKNEFEEIKQKIPKYDMMIEIFYSKVKNNISLFYELNYKNKYRLLILAYSISFEELHKSMRKLMEDSNLYFDVICHNDLNSGNILKFKNTISFIDFEFVSFNDIHLEFARMFYLINRYYCFKYQRFSKIYWTKEKQKRFLKAYFKGSKDIQYDKMIKKIEIVSPITNYFFFLYGIVSVLEDNTSILKKLNKIRQHLKVIYASKVLKKQDYSNLKTLIDEYGAHFNKVL